MQLIEIFKSIVDLAEENGNVIDVMYKHKNNECAVTFESKGKTHEIYYSEKMEGNTDAIQN